MIQLADVPKRYIKMALGFRVFDEGGVKLGGPFSLSLHRNGPYKSAPKSPIYFNFGKRQDQPSLRSYEQSDGSLSLELIEAFGEPLYEFVRLCGIDLDGTIIVGVPRGGTPFAYALARAAQTCRKKTFVLELDKEILTAPLALRGRFMVLEDVMTTAASSLRVIEALRRSGATVAHCLSVVDREHGGGYRLNEAHVSSYSFMSASWLLDLYVEQGRITSAERDEALAYPMQLKEYCIRRGLRVP